VHELGLCDRGVHRRVHAGRHAVLGQRRSDLWFDRAVGPDRRLHEPNVRRRRVRRRVRPRAKAVQRTHSPDLRHERPMAERYCMRQRV
jgi:hypothetical protein